MASGVTNTGFDPILGNPLWKFLAAAKAQGINARIISGVRDDQDQAQLVANAAATRAGTPLPYPERGRVPVAAPVGSSAHEFGLAADVQADNPADQAKLIALGQQFGLSHPMANDPTHFEAPGWRQVAANDAPPTPWGQVPPSSSMLAAGGEPISASTPGGGNFVLPGNGAQPSRPGSPTPIPGGSSHADFIRQYAQSIGLNPNLALGIANAEGLRAWGANNPNAASTVDVTNGVPWSFGDFQLNTRNGMGVNALKAGVDPRDPNQWQAADKFALDQMKAGGVGPWKGDPVAKAYLASRTVPALPAMPGSTLNTTGSPPGASGAGAGGSSAPSGAEQPKQALAGFQAGSPAEKSMLAAGKTLGLDGSGGSQSEPPSMPPPPPVPQAQAMGGPMMMGAGGQNTFGRNAAQQNLAQQGFMVQPSLAALTPGMPQRPMTPPGSATGMPGLPGTTLNSPSQLQMALMSGQMSPYDLYANQAAAYGS